MKCAWTILLLAVCLLAIRGWATNAPAAADTNFIDPAITADNPQIKQLTDQLAASGGASPVALGNMLNEKFLFASLLWGSVATGYLIYARAQRMIAPFLGGVVMMGASFFVVSWFWMSVASIATMLVTHWLARRID